MKQWLPVVLVVLLAACGGGGGGSNSPVTPTPTTPTNHNPVITSLNFSPAFGIQELTTFSFSASATDQDGDGLTYTWDIAGNQRTGTNGSIIFTNGGNGTVRLTVTDGKNGSVSDTRSFTVGSATGTWVGTSGPSALGTFRMVLTQAGTRVTGTYWDSLYGDGRIDPAEPGSIDASGNIAMRVKQGPFADWYFNCAIDSTGRRISGTVRGSGFTGQPFSMAKQ